jgi:hypothetical protein
VGSQVKRNITCNTQYGFYPTKSTSGLEPPCGLIKVQYQITMYTNKETVKECRGKMKTLRVKYIRNNATANLLKSETSRWNTKFFFRKILEKSTYPRPRIFQGVKEQDNDNGEKPSLKFVIIIYSTKCYLPL